MSSRAEQTHRRVVTGHSGDGQSVFLSDGDAARATTFEHLPGLRLTEIWAASKSPVVPVDDADPNASLTSFQPPPGGSRFRVVEIPPQRATEDGSLLGFDAVAAFEELARKAPADWTTEATTGSRVGMHATETVDYVCVLSGEVWLELDSGAETLLKPGDCVVQNGTRHAWHNRGHLPCVYVTVMIGAHRA